MAGPSTGRRIAAAIAAGLALWSAGPTAQVQAPTPSSTERLTSQSQRAADRIASLTREAADLARAQQSLLVELRRLEVDRSLAEARATDAVDAWRTAVAELEAADGRVADLDARVTASRGQVRATLRRLYIGATAERAAWHVAAGESGRETARAVRLLGAVAARDRELIESYRSTRDRLLVERGRRRERAEAAATASAVATRARTAADRAMRAQRERVTAIERERQLASSLAVELQRARARLDAEVALAGDGGRIAALALPIKPFRGKLPWPATGPVARRFGLEPSSRFGTRVVRQGIELDTQAGSVVRAVHDGRVVFAGAFAGFGQLAIVDHGQAAFSLYGFLDELLVARGDMVDRGATIGHSGRSPAGRAATYFELRIDGRPVNPLEWLIRR